MGKDTHALSEPAFISVLEVLAANGVDVIVQENNGFTPTPAISNAILVHNKKDCATQQETVAKCGGIVSQQQIVMSKVVTERVSNASLICCKWAFAATLIVNRAPVK